jgi:hypothetical protein
MSQIICQPGTSYGVKRDGNYLAKDWDLLTVALQSFTGPVFCMGLSDFHFIVFFTQHLADKQFATEANLKQAVPSCLQNTLH